MLLDQMTLLSFIEAMYKLLNIVSMFSATFLGVLILLFACVGLAESNRHPKE